MRSLQILHLYAGNLYGGIERMLATLAKHRKLEPRIEHHFALCFEGRLADELRSHGISPTILGQVKLRQPWSVLVARRRLTELLKRQKFDAAITHACWPHAVFGSTVRRQRVLLVNWVHDILNGMHVIDMLASRCSPDLVIANSHYTATHVTKVFPNSAQTVVHCLVEPISMNSDVRSSLRKVFEAPDDQVVILQASRMEAWKGHRSLLRAAAKLPFDRDWVLWFAGAAQRPEEESYVDELRRLIADLNLQERVRFLGQRDDIPSLMLAADIYCQPNEGPEPFGIAIVEALYARLPVVCSDQAGPAEIVDDNCGMRIPVGDIDALASALCKLTTDPELRRELGQNGTARAAFLTAPAQQLAQLAQRFVSLV